MPLTQVQAQMYAGGPAFSAYRSASSVTLVNASFTKIGINTEEYDTANCFDTSTSRFTPNVAGYYSVSGNVLLLGVGGVLTVGLLVVYKNGTRFKDLGYYDGPATNGFMLNSSCQIYLNGTTDYIELYVLASGTSTVTYAGDFGQYTYFQASLVRAA
jgi:hypothetical protein